MKFTLFALLAAFFVLSANAGTLQLPMKEPESVMQYEDIAIADVDDEALDEFGVFNIFSATWWAIRAGLRTVKGFNCLIKWVVGIQASAVQYKFDVIDCGVTATKSVTNLINANIKIIQTADNIIHLKTTICASTEDEQKPSISNRCTAKTLAQIYSLYKQVNNAISLAKKIPQTGPNAVTCVSNATNTLKNYYTQFPSNIKSCSKLTKK